MKTILKVFKHEFKMYTRDRKLLINSLLMPILIYPVIIAIVSLGVLISMQGEVKGIKVSIQGKNIEVSEALKKTKGLIILEDKVYSDKDILDRNVDAIVILPEDKNQTIKIKYDSTKKSFSSKITDSIDNLRKNYITTVLEDKGLKYENINIISFKDLNEKGKEISPFTMAISISLPMLFLIFPMISISYITTDIAAGEKEKMTLEPLLCTKTSRYKVLLGKLFFTSITSVLISLVSVIVLGLTALAAIAGFNVHMSSINISFPVVVITLVILMLTVIFLSAIQLTLSFFAKNYKESQLLLTPLMIIVMVPILITMAVPDNPMFYQLPIFNVVVLLKQLMSGVINVANILIVISWLLVYIVISVLLSIMAITNEKFIFRV